MELAEAGQTISLASIADRASGNWTVNYLSSITVNGQQNVYHLWESKSVPPCLMEALSH